MDPKKNPNRDFKEDLRLEQRATLLRYLSKKDTMKWDLMHNKMKRNLKIFSKSMVVSNFILLGFVTFYWFEYDMIILNPKLSRYITHRFGY